MGKDDLIIVFAKPARPGAVKTRLLGILTPDQAAEFHLAALSDVVKAARHTARRVELHVAGGADSRAGFEALYPETAILSQYGDDLGARIAGALEGAFDRGFRRALVVGSDHPTLPPSHLETAFDLLATVDLAFGPARDGGYYAAGARSAAWPAARAAFERIPWSTGGVLKSTLRQARTAGLSFALTPEWYDVDRPEDLDLLARDAAPDSAALCCVRKVLGRV